MLLVYSREISDNGFEGLVTGTSMTFDTNVTSLRLWKLVEIHSLHIMEYIYNIFDYKDLALNAVQALEKKA